MPQLQMRGHNNPLECCHRQKWNELCGSVFWNTKPHTNVSGILLTMSHWRLLHCVWLRVLQIVDRWSAATMECRLLCVWLSLLWHQPKPSQTHPNSSKFFSTSQKDFRIVNLKVCIYPLLFLFIIFFSEERSSKNHAFKIIPECPTVSGSDSSRELYNVGFQIKKVFGNEPASKLPLHAQ